MRQAAISSIAFFDRELVAHYTIDHRSTEFPKKSSTGNFSPNLSCQSVSCGHLPRGVPVQKCKTAHVTLLLPPIGCSLP